MYTDNVIKVMKSISSETSENVLLMSKEDVSADIVSEQILSNNIKKTAAQNKLIYQCVIEIFELSLKSMHLQIIQSLMYN